MQTIYEQALLDKVKRVSKDEPEFFALVVDTWNKLNDDFWEEDYVDFFFQKCGGVYTLNDAYCFALMHQHVCSGDVGLCDLNVDCEPIADRFTDEQEQNLRSALARIRPVPGLHVAMPQFDARVWGGTQGADGELSWSPYLVFRQIDVLASSNAEKWIPAASVPIEIGYQSAVKSLVSMRYTGLARWPYGSKSVRVFYWVGEKRYSRPTWGSV